ncbi:MAG TPA: elongation factor G [Deltaproteobacteria bacterium]|nr:elongation factor G [Deltaproteobacteria bacterium]
MKGQEKGKRLSRVRNIGFVAHIDAGKTTVTERVLYYAGKIHRMGEVHDGQATMDWLPQEQERGITITSAVTTCAWKNHEIHIIDTPGHVDFTIEVERSLRVLDGAVVILCAVGGVEAQTETVWQQCRRYRVPALAFVNKLDRLGADYAAVIEQIASRLEVTPVPIQIPYYQADTFKGVTDIITWKTLIWDDDTLGATYTEQPIPEDALQEAHRAREKLLEVLADYDDDITELYLRGEIPEETKIKQVLRKLALENRIIPVLCGSALKNKGIQTLIDSIIEYLPAPPEVIPPSAHDKTTGEVVPLMMDSDGTLVAYVFKVYVDEGRRMVYLRIYSGKLRVGDEVFNTTRETREKVARLFEMHAHHKQRIDQAVAGDIVAAVGLKEAKTGDTISEEGMALVLEPIVILKPVISVAIEPKNSEASTRLQLATQKIMEEDPTIKVHEDPDTGQVILAGMGELHLEIALDRFKTAFGVDINVGKPQVLYCSTIHQTSRASKVFEKVIGDTPHYGHVVLNARPGKRGAGNTFSVDSSLDGGMRDYVLAGLSEACLADPLTGYEVVDIDVTVENVEINEKTTGQGLKIASQMALQDAIRKVGSVQLEPVMEMDVLTPEESVGEVVGDLSSRKASIVGVVIKAKSHSVKALVPLSQTFGYSTALRSLTRGRGSFSMKFHGFDRV